RQESNGAKARLPPIPKQSGEQGIPRPGRRPPRSRTRRDRRANSPASLFAPKNGSQQTRPPRPHLLESGGTPRPFHVASRLSKNRQDPPDPRASKLNRPAPGHRSALQLQSFPANLAKLLQAGLSQERRAG